MQSFFRMKAHETESPKTVLSKVYSGKFESPVSSKVKLSGIEKSRKIANKILTSNLLQQRQGIRIIQNGVDLTPKLLTHPTFSSLEERQVTAFEVLELFHTSSTSQLLNSASTMSGAYTSSTILSRTSSLPSGSVVADDCQFQSMLSTQSEEIQFEDIDKVPSPFYLPRYRKILNIKSRVHVTKILIFDKHCLPVYLCLLNSKHVDSLGTRVMI